MYVRRTLVGDLFINAHFLSFARILVYICHYCTILVDGALLVDDDDDDDDDDDYDCLLYSAILRSRAGSLRSHVILH